MILPFEIAHKIVCKVFRIREDALYDKSREHTYLIPRQVFIWHYKGHSALYRDLATYLGMHRTTIYPSVKTTQTMFETKNYSYYPYMLKFMEEAVKYNLDIEKYCLEKGILMEKLGVCDIKHLGAFDTSIEKHCIKKGLLTASTTTDNPFHIILEKRGKYHGLVVVVAPMDITPKESRLLDVFVQAGYKYWVAQSRFEAIKTINDYVLNEGH